MDPASVRQVLAAMHAAGGQARVPPNLPHRSFLVCPDVRASLLCTAHSVRLYATHFRRPTPLVVYFKPREGLVHAANLP